MVKQDELAGKRLVILGLARQGKALARFAAQAGAQVVVSDLRAPDKLADGLAELTGLGIQFVLGEHPLSLLDGTDVLAVSGGVPAGAPIVQAAQARGIRVTNDALEFMRRTPAQVIGITGSAGKTTTTALTGAMGQAAGRTTWIGGNIGNPLIADLARMQPGDLVVQELSSFQLELWTSRPPVVPPAVATVLNVTPNHLDRHGTLAAYAAAKANILRFQAEDGITVLNADDQGSERMAGMAPGRVRWFSMASLVDDGAYCREGQIWLRGRGGEPQTVCDVAQIRLRGRHNLANVLAAVTLADSVGIPLAAMRQAIAGFRGVPHRLEMVATINGVQYVNDSIATAPERAMAAFAAFAEPLILLAGGQDKDLVWETWAQAVQQRVKTVVLFGALAPLLAERLAAAGTPPGRDVLRVVRAPDLAAAISEAAGLAAPGDVVLLSPGGTSFDAFADFAERGDQFRCLVQALAHPAGQQEA